MAEIREKYKDDIYRPGDDVEQLSLLTETQKSDRRIEIEELFASGQTDNEIEEGDVALVE